DRFHSECLLRLPEIYACHRPMAETIQPAPRPPSEAGGPFTFGSFNNPAKLGPRTLAAWTEILRRSPNARLCLKWSGLDGRTPVAAALIARGVPPARLELLGWSRDAYEPYRRIDCALDPIVNGGNTTLDALWMGVPVVT